MPQKFEIWLASSREIRVRAQQAEELMSISTASKQANNGKYQFLGEKADFFTLLQLLRWGYKRKVTCILVCK